MRTKNKLLTAFGASKPSTNVAFDLAYSDFESTLQRLLTLDVALKSYANSLKTFHNSASSVLSSVDSLSFGGTGTVSFQQQPGGPSEMQQLAGEARVACADVDLVVSQEVSGQLEQEVLVPVKGWLQYARTLQSEVTMFQEHKALYDHYARKVAGLREAHEKRSSMGKMEKIKDTERLIRNEQKLATTTQEYTRLSDTIIRNLRAFVLSRDAALAPLLRRILRGRVVYAERIHEATGRLRAFVEDGVEECEDGGVLGQFTSVAQNGTHVGSETIMAAIASPSTVRKSSFDEFVGESPMKLNRLHNAEDNWDAFAVESEAQPANGRYGVSEPHYTPPHAVPQFMTVTAASNGYWGDQRPTPGLSTLPNAVLPTDVTVSCASLSSTNHWDAFPQASAPSTDLFSSVDWGTESAQSHLGRQQQAPVTEFRDMHLDALGGDGSTFR